MHVHSSARQTICTCRKPWNDDGCVCGKGQRTRNFQPTYASVTACGSACAKIKQVGHIHNVAGPLSHTHFQIPCVQETAPCLTPDVKICAWSDWSDWDVSACTVRLFLTLLWWSLQ